MDHLAQVFVVLRDQKLFVKRKKCSISTQEVNYLGHIISATGVAADPKKIHAMTDWTQPKTTRALRGFLGLTGYYRKFIQDYGTIARPLTQILKKGQFGWSEEATTTFQRPKQAMITTPVLRLPNFEQPFIVECDACGTALGRS